MPRIRIVYLFFLMGLLISNSAAADDPFVGDIHPRRVIVPTNQILTPAGRLVTFPGRPTDLAVLDSKGTIAVKNINSLIILDVEAVKIRQTLPLPSGGHAVLGLAVASDGNTIYTSGIGGKVFIAHRDNARALYRWSGFWSVPAPRFGGDSAPTGLALSANGETLLVLSGRGNTLWLLNRRDGKVGGKPINVGVAPFGVVAYSDSKAYVTNWGGEPPRSDQPQAHSSRTPVRIDRRTGVATAGSVSVVDLKARKTIKSITTGRHSSGLVLSRDRRFLYVACANSDAVAVINTRTDELVETIAVRPQAYLPFGSSPNALAPSMNGKFLYVANGTNNAVAVIELGPKACGQSATNTVSRTTGFIPVGWYPGAVVVRARPGARARAGERYPDQLIVANIKGQGSRHRKIEGGQGFNSRDYLGSVSIIPAPNSKQLATYTQEVARNNRQALALTNPGKATRFAPPQPVPTRHGEPSLIKHVIYIIKENRTYDQVFGDIKEGNGDPVLVMFGNEVTPNQHALARQFVLLDNYYCAGVLSADGHAWATEAYVTDYLERHFGGFVRSYPYDGDDPLAYASSGFLWDNALEHGLSFRDYGEFIKGRIIPPTAMWKDLYADYLRGTSRIKVEARPTVGSLRDHFCRTYVGFPATVPDVYRAREFLKEFREFEKGGLLPKLIIMLLPNNHTSGTKPGFPTPRAMVADNDLALGQIVEAITKSRFWPDTAIFVTEDDPQAGLDHVDGHRTIAQVISPYTRRGLVDHSFYSQISMVKTIELILGLPPMNQLDLAAPVMRACFQEQPDFTSFSVRPNQIPLNEMNPKLADLSGMQLFWAKKSLALDLDDVDDADDLTLNQILWHSVNGYNIPYPKVAGSLFSGLTAIRNRPGQSIVLYFPRFSSIAS